MSGTVLNGLKKQFINLSKKGQYQDSNLGSSDSKAQSKQMKNETSIAEVHIRSGRKWLVLHVKWERQRRLWELRGDGSGFTGDGNFPALLSSHSGQHH